MIHFYTSSIAWFSDVFKGVQKWIIGLKWVKGTQFRTVPLAAEAYFAEGVECVFITIFTKSSTIDVWIHLWTECIRNFFSDFALLITAQKMKFSLNDFFSKCDQIRRNLRIWSYLLKKSLMENSIFCAANMSIFLSIWKW